MIVAPFTGAWIETCVNRHHRRRARSRPSRARGLKRRVREILRRRRVSRPSRARGLKLCSFPVPRPEAAVAPFTGAWIETDA